MSNGLINIRDELKKFIRIYVNENKSKEQNELTTNLHNAKIQYQNTFKTSNDANFASIFFTKYFKMEYDEYYLDDQQIDTSLMLLITMISYCEYRLLYFCKLMNSLCLLNGNAFTACDFCVLSIN